jgi:hypothetical protein
MRGRGSRANETGAKSAREWEKGGVLARREESVGSVKEVRGHGSGGEKESRAGGDRFSHDSAQFE